MLTVQFLWQLWYTPVKVNCFPLKQEKHAVHFS